MSDYEDRIQSIVDLIENGSLDPQAILGGILDILDSLKGVTITSLQGYQVWDSQGILRIQVGKF